MGIYVRVILLYSLLMHYIFQERQRVIYDEQKKLAQQQAQIKSQMARYEDELARKRMQANSLLAFWFYGCMVLCYLYQCGMIFKYIAGGKRTS